MALHLCGSREFPVLPESLESLTFTTAGFPGDPSRTPESAGPESRKRCELEGLYPAAVWVAVRMYHLELITTLPQSVG